MWPFKDKNEELDLLLKEVHKELNNVKNELALKQNIPQQYSNAPPPVMTQTEIDRLKSLEDERVTDQKRILIAAFMDLSDDMREEILISGRVCRFSRLLQNGSPISQEETNLKNKRNANAGYMLKGSDEYNKPTLQINNGIQLWLQDEEVITLEELEGAHAGKAIDEILLTDDKEE